MRIVFLSGTLEPGRDGVGDYIRRLAGEISRMGHAVAIVALNDKFITTEFDGFQSSDGSDLPVFRLPSGLPSKDRFLEAKEWISKFKPDWLSLQYVAFSFNKKGLPFGIDRQLSALAPGCRWHMMFHELWVGIDKKRYLKSAIVSNIQKFLINRTIRHLKAAPIHTHLPEFRHQLESYGWKVKNLPLFSNIDVASSPESASSNNVIRIGFFSQAEASESINSFFIGLKKQTLIAGLKLELIFIGGNVEKLKVIGSEFDQLNVFDHPIQYTGFLQPTEVSLIMQTCTLGITPIPRHALGKSSSLAVFLLHGIPVAAPNVHPGYSETEIGFESAKLRSSIVLEPSVEAIKLATEMTIKSKDEIKLSTVASNFLSDLANYE